MAQRGAGRGRDGFFGIFSGSAPAPCTQTTEIFPNPIPFKVNNQVQCTGGGKNIKFSGFVGIFIGIFIGIGNSVQETGGIKGMDAPLDAWNWSQSCQRCPGVGCWRIPARPWMFLGV